MVSRRRSIEMGLVLQFGLQDGERGSVCVL